MFFAAQVTPLSSLCLRTAMLTSLVMSRVTMVEKKDLSSSSMVRPSNMPATSSAIFLIPSLSL